MSQSLDLSTLDWQLIGFHPGYWRASVSMELGMPLLPDVAPMPVRVPSSVQKTLRDAGVVPDWNKQLNSRACEWVENRDWVYQTKLPREWTSRPGRKVVRCEGLDYQGVVILNQKKVGEFVGTFVPHEFDLTTQIVDGENTLSIVFTGVWVLFRDFVISCLF